MNPKTGISDALTLITTQLGKHFPAGSAEYISAQRKIYGGITGLSVALALGGDHLTKYNETVKKIGSAYESADPKVKNFSEVAKTLNFQLKQLSAAGSVLAVDIGTWLLPKVSSIAQWGSSVITWFKSHPLVTKIASDAAIGLFVASLVFKLGKGIATIFNNVKSVLTKVGSASGGTVGATFQEQSLVYLRIIAEATSKMAGMSMLTGAENAAGGVAVAARGTALMAGATIATVAAVAVAGTLALQWFASHGPKFSDVSKQRQLQWRGPMPLGTTNVTLNVHSRKTGSNR
jgi:hypothetical protein